MTVYQLRKALALFFLATYLVLLAITADEVDFAAAAEAGAATLAFAFVVWLTYAVIYLAPALLIVWTADRLAHRKREYGHRLVFYSLAVATTALTTLFFYANAKLFALYGYFVNGFVINLVTTPGGLESLGASSASNTTFLVIASGFVGLQIALLALTLFVYRRYGEPEWLPDGFFTLLFVLFAVATVGERVVYAWSSASGMTGITSLTQRIPYYLPTTARHLMARMGVEVKRGAHFEITDGNLNFPLHPLQVDPPAKPLNVVWLVSESWRADMLDPGIMPETWAFARRAQRFTHHYSGGNGTRVGMFTMFMGIPGNYWFPFLAKRKGAPIVDVLREQDYQMSFYSSAKFSYPEFDATIFARVPSEQLHELDRGLGWERDRRNVSDLLEFIDSRDPGRPFFTFMFFESPHARYYFPPESVIREPYTEDIDYFRLSPEQLAAEMPLIRNRYVNSVHHLDSQFGRVIQHLEQTGLLDSTIVVMLGDHGEEFMEHGRWGHNSAFTDEQTRTPFVVWIPGSTPGVSDAMTNHMDVVPTLMPLFGVRNPTREYSTGVDLRHGGVRDHAELAEWSSTAYIDREVKITLPVAWLETQHALVTGPHDEPLSEPEQQALFERKTRDLAGMMETLGRYLIKAETE